MADAPPPPHGLPLRMTTVVATAHSSPDWMRIFPEGDHRWTMGLRPTDPAAFFAPRIGGEAVRQQRARLLADDPVRHAILTPAAQGALEETIGWLPTVAGREVGEAATVAEPYERLLALGRSIEADLVWLQTAADGTHRVVGGAVCFPSSWDLAEKLEAPLRLVHDPVPGLDAALGRQIDVFLTKLEPGVAWARENWSLAADGALNHHPARPRTPFPPHPAADDVWIRLEHQLLVRLPQTRSVLFAIDVEPVPLTTLLQSAPAAERLARLLETMSPAGLEYKRIASVRSAIVQRLRGGEERFISYGMPLPG